MRSWLIIRLVWWISVVTGYVLAVIHIYRLVSHEAVINAAGLTYSDPNCIDKMTRSCMRHVSVNYFLDIGLPTFGWSLALLAAIIAGLVGMYHYLEIAKLVEMSK